MCSRYASIAAAARIRPRRVANITFETSLEIVAAMPKAQGGKSRHSREWEEGEECEEEDHRRNWLML